MNSTRLQKLEYGRFAKIAEASVHLIIKMSLTGHSVKLSSWIVDAPRIMRAMEGRPRGIVAR
jgi:hypothetical protein